jgi:hypothetical protein
MRQLLAVFSQVLQQGNALGDLSRGKGWFHICRC